MVDVERYMYRCTGCGATQPVDVPTDMALDLDEDVPGETFRTCERVWGGCGRERTLRLVTERDLAAEELVDVTMAALEARSGLRYLRVWIAVAALAKIDNHSPLTPGPVAGLIDRSRALVFSLLAPPRVSVAYQDTLDADPDQPVSMEV